MTGSGENNQLGEVTEMFGISIKKSVAVGFSVGLMGFASQASALAIGDANFIGLIDPNHPSNPASEVANINILVDQPLGSGPTTIGDNDFTRSNNLCDGSACPDAVLAGAVKDDTSPSTSVDVSGFDYLLAKYDADQAGAYVWYVGDLDGVQTIPGTAGTCGAEGCGLSHWSLYNPGENNVPEPMSLALLALGFLGLAFARRRAAS